MKKIYKYIAIAILLIDFTACSQDDDFIQPQSDIVEIASAYIAKEVQTRVNTLEDGKNFETGDNILLINNSRTDKFAGTYTYSGSAWSLSEGMVLYASGTNNFTAYYPAIVNFTLPANQSSATLIKAADRMTATATADKGNPVSLPFKHKMSKVTINVELSSQFATDETIDALTIYSNAETPVGVTPYNTPDTKTYTAILTPGAYDSDATFIKIRINDKKLTVSVNPTLTTGLEEGKHYTFSLTVNDRDLAQMQIVDIAEWGSTDSLGDYDSQEKTTSVTVAPEMTHTYIKGMNTTVSITNNSSHAITLESEGAFIDGIASIDNVTAILPANSEVTISLKQNGEQIFRYRTPDGCRITYDNTNGIYLSSGSVVIENNESFTSYGRTLTNYTEGALTIPSDEISLTLTGDQEVLYNYRKNSTDCIIAFSNGAINIRFENNYTSLQEGEQITATRYYSDGTTSVPVVLQPVSGNCTFEFYAAGTKDRLNIVSGTKLSINGTEYSSGTFSWPTN